MKLTFYMSPCNETDGTAVNSLTCERLKVTAISLLAHIGVHECTLKEAYTR